MNNYSKDLAAKFTANKLRNSLYLILGSGSTVNRVIDHLTDDHSMLSELKAVSASSSTSNKLMKYAITEISIDEMKEISGDSPLICIDGADQVCFDDNAKAHVILKGHGAALVREKILWEESDIVYVVIDESKISKSITKYIPVEVIPLAVRDVTSEINKLYPELELKLRYQEEDNPLITDNNNNIIEVHHSNLNVVEFHNNVRSITGVVDTGIFDYKLVRKCVFVIGFADHVDFRD
ncbi:MAG: ribose 5-phosphate isomerase A [Candidatus Kariarchaeaceae archaeon]